MTSEIFVKAFKVITKSALSGLLKTFIDPPGRKPAPDLVRISHFIRRLSDEDKKTFSDALELVAKQSACNILLILDGALAIESSEQKGKLELYYNNGNIRIRLNDTDNVMLNDIFRQM